MPFMQNLPMPIANPPFVDHIFDDGIPNGHW
jgi:hypothetical protein